MNFFKKRINFEPDRLSIVLLVCLVAIVPVYNALYLKKNHFHLLSALYYSSQEMEGLRYRNRYTIEHPKRFFKL